MKHFIFSKTGLFLMAVMLLVIALCQGIKAFALVHDKALLHVNLVSVHQPSAENYDSNGFLTGTFVGIFEFKGHHFELPVSAGERFDQMRAGKPVKHVKMLSASDVGIETPFWGPMSKGLIVLAFLVTYLILHFYPYMFMSKKQSHTDKPKVLVENS